MGFFSNLIAKSPVSTIPATTDTIANQYKELKKSTTLSDKDIYRKIIELRYSVIPLKEKWRYDSMMKEVENMDSLKLLVFEILTQEAPNILSTGNDNLVKTLSIIQERLRIHDLI